MRPEPRFFDRFRAELARYAPFVHLVGAPAPSTAVAAATAALGMRLPASYRDFLASWNGASLFHESLRVHGVGALAVAGDVVDATRAARAEEAIRGDELAVAEHASGERLVMRAGEDAVYRVEPDGPDGGERLRVASTFERYLTAVMLREGVLHDEEGEFREGVLDPEGDELLPKIALRAEERVLRLDPEAAFPRWEAARALRRIGRAQEAERRLREAVEIEPSFAWAWFDLGRLCHEAGRYGEAEALFARGATAAADLGAGDAALRAALFHAWACRAAFDAGAPARASEHRARALRMDPDIARAQKEAARAALEQGHEQSARELAALAHALAPTDLEALDLSRRTKS